MKLEHTGRVVANGAAAQVYFPKEYSQQFVFPLDLDSGFVARIIPRQAIVLFPESRVPDYPVELTIERPETYRQMTIDVLDDRPETAMTDDTDDARPRTREMTEESTDGY